jgi:hypothetical protein
VRLASIYTGFSSHSPSDTKPVTFSVVSGPARVSGSTLTITGAGAVVVAADQADNAAYSAAPWVTQTIVVNKANSTTAIKRDLSPHRKQ